MRVHVAMQVRRPGIARRRLQRVVRHALRRQRGAGGTAIGVALVSDRAMQALNRAFLHRDRPTDVLAFPAGARKAQVPGRGGYLGDVVISVDRARVQARAAGHPVGSEIALLAVHGVLHLMGYDDHRPREAVRMTRRQRTLLAEAGIKVTG
jgi:probable rRNA maturation factor